MFHSLEVWGILVLMVIVVLGGVQSFRKRRTNWLGLMMLMFLILVPVLIGTIHWAGRMDCLRTEPERLEIQRVVLFPASRRFLYSSVDYVVFYETPQHFVETISFPFAKIDFHLPAEQAPFVTFRTCGSNRAPEIHVHSLDEIVGLEGSPLAEQ